MTLGSASRINSDAGTLNLDVASGNAITTANSLGNISLSIGGAGSVTVADPIAQGTSTTLALTKDGNGTLTLSGASTFTGGVTLNSGTLNINNLTALGTAAGTFAINGGTINNTSAGALVIANTNPITVGDNFAYGGTHALTLPGTVDLGGATRTITVNGTTNGLTFTGILSNGTGLTKQGAGTMILSVGASSNSYSGITTLSAGTLQGATSQFAATPTNPFGSTLLQIDGGILQLRSGGATGSGTGNTTVENVTFGNNVTVGANATIDVGRTTTSTAATNKTLVFGTLSIGANTLNVTGGNTYALSFGATTLTGNAVFNPTTANLTLNNISGASNTIQLTRTSGTGIVNFVGGGHNTSGLVTISSGELDLNKTTTFDGIGANGVTVAGGTLKLLAANQINDAATVTVNSGTFNNNGFSDTLGSLNVTGGTVSGAGVITVASTGTTAVSGGPTFSSALVTGTSGLALSASSVTGALTLNGNVVVDSTGGASTLGGTSVVINTAQSWTNNNANTLSVVGPLTYTGLLTLNGGSFQFSTGASTTGAGGVKITGGSTAIHGGTTLNPIFGSGALELNSGTFKNSTVSTAKILDNGVSITGDFTFDSGGATGHNTFSGAASATGDRILTANTSTTSFTNLLTLGGNLTAQGTGALTLSGGIALGGSDRTLTGNTTGTTTISGVLNSNSAGNKLVLTGTGVTVGAVLVGTNNPAIEVNGAGNYTFNGASTYAGGTTLTSGTLVLDLASTLPSNGPVGTGTLTLAGGTVRTAGTSRIVGNAVSITADTTFGATSAAGVLTLSGAVGTGADRALTFNNTTSVVSGLLTLGGNLTTSGTGGTTFSGGIALGGSDRTLTGNTTGATTISGVLSSTSASNKLVLTGSGVIVGAVLVGTNNPAIEVNGAGTYTFNGASTFTSGVTLTAGTLNINNLTALGTAAGTFSINSGTTINNTSAGALVIANTNPITVGGNFAYGGTQALTLPGTVDLGGATRTITVNGTTNGLTFTGVLSNATGLTKDGPGTLILSAEASSNSYTGTTTLTAGTLEGATIQFAATPANPFGSTALQLNGGILQLRSVGATGGPPLGNTNAETVNFNNNVTVGGNTTINVDRIITTSASGKTLRLGTLNIGANTLTVTGANAYGLRFGATTASGAAIFTNNNPGNSAVSGLTLDSLTLDNSITTGTTTTITVGGSGPSSITGAITNNSLDSTKKLALTKTGAGTLTLSGTNNYSGGTIINGGTLTANADANLGAATGGITFSGNSTLAMGGTIAHNRVITLNSSVTATIFAGASNNYNNSEKVTGAGNLLFQQTGSGARALRFNSTANDFTGTVKVDNESGQSISVFFNSLVDSASSGAGNIIMTMTGNGGTTSFNYGSGAIAPLTLTNRRLELTGTAGTVNAIFSNQSTSHAVTFNSNLLVSSTGNKGLTLDAAAGPNNVFAGEIDNGNVSSATQMVSITKTGGGTWALSNAGNGFTGTINVAAGTLSYASAGGANPITFSNTSGAATLSYTGSGQTMSGAINAGTVTSGTVTLDSSGAGAVNYSNGASLGFAGSGIKKLVLSGTNTGSNTLAGDWVNNTGAAATLTKNGTGTWIISGDNTYSGITTINAGVLEAVDGAGLPTASILQLRGGVFQSSGTFNRDISTAVGDVNWDTSSGGFAARSGILNLQLNNSTASVTWNSSSMVPTGQVLIFGSSSADNLVDFQNGLNLGSSGSGQRTITVNDNSGSTTDIARISGAITNTAAGWGIIKDGAGTLELTNANNYTGATSVDAGKLVVGVAGVGSITSNVTVKNGGTLGGSGTITGTLTVEDGGTHAPGNSPGLQTVNGATTYNSGSIFAWDLAANLDGSSLTQTWDHDNNVDTPEITARGSAYDAVNINGSLTVQSGAFFRVIQNAGLDFSQPFWESNQEWSNIFKVTGTVAGWAADTFVAVYDTNNNPVSGIAQYGSFTISGTTLNWSAVPEPTSALAGLLLTAGLLRRRRK